MEATDREQAYWGTERASYDDELDAWRERTARPAGPELASAIPGQAFIGGLLGPVVGRIRAANAPGRAQLPIESPLLAPRAA